MRKAVAYRLIKEYPNSMPIGTIFEFDESWRLYKVGTQFNTEWQPSYFIEWIGEYFEICE